MYLDIYEIYRKMSFRNRCIIAGAEGTISLSIPLKDGRNQQLPVYQVQISNSEKWQGRHYKSIASAYRRAPFFDHYEQDLAFLYQNHFDRLAEWNLQCLSWVKEKINWPAEVLLTTAAVSFKKEDVNDLRNLVVPKNFTDYKPVKYRQVFEERTGFVPNLSILDLIFNVGPKAGKLLSEASRRV